MDPTLAVVFVNGVQQPVPSSSGFSGPTTGLTINGGGVAGPAENSDFGAAAYLFWSRALADSELRSVSAWLAARYGLLGSPLWAAPAPPPPAGAFAFSGTTFANANCPDSDIGAFGMYLQPQQCSAYCSTFPAAAGFALFISGPGDAQCWCAKHLSLFDS